MHHTIQGGKQNLERAGLPALCQQDRPQHSAVDASGLGQGLPLLLLADGKVDYAADRPELDDAAHSRRRRRTNRAF